MGLRRRYKVKHPVNTNSFRDGYDGYKVYLMREEMDNSWAKAEEIYLITRESLSAGQSIIADDQTELLSASRYVNKTYSGLRVMVFRPERALSAHFSILDDIPHKEFHKRFSSSGIDQARHRVVMAQRPATEGYREPGTLSYIFCTSSFRKGESIPVPETKKLNDLPDMPACDFYVHNEDAYKARLWAAIRAVCK